MDYKSLMGYGDKKKKSKPNKNKVLESIKDEFNLNEGKVGTRDGVCCHDCKVENIINDIFRGE